MFLQPYPTFACPGGDGRNFVLLTELYYTTQTGVQYRGIRGATTDGASTPQSLWNLYPPFGRYWLPAVLHDCGYRTMLERWDAAVGWHRVALDKDVVDSLLLESMEAQGVSLIDRQTIYNAVKKFGAQAFLDDLAQPITIVNINNK